MLEVATAGAVQPNNHVVQLFAKHSFNEKFDKRNQNHADFASSIHGSGFFSQHLILT